MQRCAGEIGLITPQFWGYGLTGNDTMAENMSQENTMKIGLGGLMRPEQGFSRTAMKLVPLVLVGALAVTGCQRTSGFYSGDRLPSRQEPISIEPAPLTPVEQGELQPAEPSNDQGVPGVTEEPNNTQVATLEPPPNAQPVTRQAMVGAWTVSTGGSSCQIFLALTKWSGGYRAASRGCSAPSISDVQAWDVREKQVVLVNSAGGTAATLYRSSDQRYDGSTVGGGAISFTR